MRERPGSDPQIPLWGRQLSAATLLTLGSVLGLGVAVPLFGWGYDVLASYMARSGFGLSGGAMFLHLAAAFGLGGAG